MNLKKNIYFSVQVYELLKTISLAVVRTVYAALHKIAEDGIRIKFMLPVNTDLDQIF